MAGRRATGRADARKAARAGTVGTELPDVRRPAKYARVFRAGWRGKGCDPRRFMPVTASPTDRRNDRAGAWRRLQATIRRRPIVTDYRRYAPSSGQRGGGATFCGVRRRTPTHRPIPAAAPVRNPTLRHARTYRCCCLRRVQQARAMRICSTQAIAVATVSRSMNEITGWIGRSVPPGRIRHQCRRRRFPVDHRGSLKFIRHLGFAAPSAPRGRPGTSWLAGPGARWRACDDPMHRR